MSAIAKVTEHFQVKNLSMTFQSYNNARCDLFLLMIQAYTLLITHLQCGYSALHAAAMWGHLAVAQILLEYGASSEVRDKVSEN